MLIVCPNCATSYQIEAELVGAPERSVRCARCLTVWTMDTRAAVPAIVRAEDSEILAQGPLIPPQERHVNAATPVRAMAAVADSDLAGAADQAPREATRPEGVAADQAEPTSDAAPHMSSASDAEAARDLTTADDAEAAHADADTDADDATADEAVRPFDTDAPSIVPSQNPDDSIRSSGRSPRAARVTRFLPDWYNAESDARSRKTRIRLAGLGLALLAICNIALISYRDAIVRKLPQTASLYAAIGLPVNLRGLAFADLHTSYETQDGVDVLLVQGAIISKSEQPVAVPPVRLAVRNGTHQEIYAWTAKPERALLRPQERLPFKARLASPPQDASDVLVRFLNSRDLNGRSL